MYYMPLLYTFLLIGPAIAGIAFFRKLSTGWHWFLLGLCVIYGISPFLMTWGAYGLAKSFDCSAEAVRFRCPSPVWLGDVVSGLAMSHWLAIFAIPSAVLGAIWSADFGDFAASALAKPLLWRIPKYKWYFRASFLPKSSPQSNCRCMFGPG